MIRIIKMDLFRLFKTKSAWIMLIIGVLFTTSSNFMVKSDLEQMKSDMDYYLQAVSHSETYISKYETNEEYDMVNVNIGIMVNTNPDWVQDGYKISVLDLFNINAASRIYMIFIGIAVTIFVRAERKNGYIKAIAGLLPTRAGFAFSKFFTAGIYTLITFAINMITTAICSKIVFGYINFNSFEDFIPKTLTLLFLHLSFSAVITAICIFSNSSGLTIFITIVLGTGLFEIPYSMLNFVLIQFCKVAKSFNIMRYTVSGNVSILSAAAENSDLIRACIVSAVFMVLFMAGGIYSMKKQDVK